MSMGLDPIFNFIIDKLTTTKIKDSSSFQEYFKTHPLIIGQQGYHKLLGLKSNESLKETLCFYLIHVVELEMLDIPFNRSIQLQQVICPFLNIDISKASDRSYLFKQYQAFLQSSQQTQKEQNSCNLQQSEKKYTPTILRTVPYDLPDYYKAFLNIGQRQQSKIEKIISEQKKFKTSPAEQLREILITKEKPIAPAFNQTKIIPNQIPLDQSPHLQSSFQKQDAQLNQSISQNQQLNDDLLIINTHQFSITDSYASSFINKNKKQEIKTPTHDPIITPSQINNPTYEDLSSVDDKQQLDPTKMTDILKQQSKEKCNLDHLPIESIQITPNSINKEQVSSTNLVNKYQIAQINTSQIQKEKKNDELQEINQIITCDEYSKEYLQPQQPIVIKNNVTSQSDELLIKQQHHKEQLQSQQLQQQEYISNKINQETLSEVKSNKLLQPQQPIMIEQNVTSQSDKLLIKEYHHNEQLQSQQIYQQEYISNKINQEILSEEKNNLKTMVDDIIKSKNQPNQQLKEMLVIQMLDGFDSFKSYNTLHREIKPLNFFSNLKGVIRHCQLGFVSGVSQSQNYNKSIKLTQFYFDLEIEKRFFRLLELDNLIILCGQCIQHGITEIYQVKGILAKFKEQKNKKFNTFQIVEIFLHLKYQQRKPPADLIKYLMRKQNNEPNFMDLVKQQAKIISYSSLKKQANESIYLEQNQLIELFEKLFNNKDYNNSFDIIFGSYGMVIANKNKKRVQDIKSLIIDFYAHQFTKEQNNLTHLVYEFDRFSCSLIQYFQKLKIDAELSQYDTLQIYDQITGSISNLQSFNLIYNDLQLIRQLFDFDKGQSNHHQTLALLVIAKVKVNQSQKPATLKPQNQLEQVQTEKCQTNNRKPSFVTSYRSQQNITLSPKLSFRQSF
ncbi:hypothetical protein ABPG72_020869 [Tetrahymena utriculariae]